MMNRTSKIGLIVIVPTSLFILIAFCVHELSVVDLIGHKDLETIEKNNESNKKILLTAEYRDGTNSCEITLMDSVNIEINDGNSIGNSIFHTEYELDKDTIKILDGLQQSNKIVRKLLIRDNKLLFRSDKNNQYDSLTFMNIMINKIHEKAAN
jgi:hypothetical protein